jgi:hypothetical protein
MEVPLWQCLHHFFFPCHFATHTTTNFSMYTTPEVLASLLTTMEKIVGPRIMRNSSSLVFVVQQRVSSNRARATTQGSTNRAGNPVTHSHITSYIGACLENKISSKTTARKDRLILFRSLITWHIH